MRVQFFPTEKLKIEPWLINGWQSYAKFNSRPGLGLQVLWRPAGWISILSNSYAYGTDTLNQPNRNRWHSDDSIEIKFYDEPSRFVDKSAFSLTIDAGCENGGGVVCGVWFDHDLFAVTAGGGAITNPGRYLVLVPPINGATAASGTPYFTANPGDQFKALDATLTFDWMPSQFITFRIEYNFRAANVPYFAGPGGITPPGASNTTTGSQVTVGSPGSLVPGWSPDLRKTENRINMALLVKM
jgi:hypothetical protein